MNKVIEVLFLWIDNKIKLGWHVTLILFFLFEDTVWEETPAVSSVW